MAELDADSSQTLGCCWLPLILLGFLGAMINERPGVGAVVCTVLGVYALLLCRKQPTERRYGPERPVPWLVLFLGVGLLWFAPSFEFHPKFPVKKPLHELVDVPLHIEGVKPGSTQEELPEELGPPTRKVSRRYVEVTTLQRGDVNWLMDKLPGLSAEAKKRMTDLGDGSGKERAKRLRKEQPSGPKFESTSMAASMGTVDQKYFSSSAKRPDDVQIMALLESTSLSQEARRQFIILASEEWEDSSAGLWIVDHPREVWEWDDRSLTVRFAGETATSVSGKTVNLKSRSYLSAGDKPYPDFLGGTTRGLSSPPKELGGEDSAPQGSQIWEGVEVYIDFTRAPPTLTRLTLGKFP